MSRRRAAGGAVRGPSSALTSFLAGLGVEPSRPLNTWDNSTVIPSGGDDQPMLAADGPVIPDQDHLDPAGAVTASTTVAGPSEVGQGIPELEDETKKRNSYSHSPPPPAKRRKRAVSVDSDDLDNEIVPSSAGPSKSATPAPAAASSTSKVPPGPLKAVGQFMECGECAKRFTVTSYTKEHPTQSNTWLCVNCCYALGIDPFAKAKKATKKAPAKKEDRAKIVHYEERRGVLALGDMCIQMIGKYIEDVEMLGDIGVVNLDRVCKIISKNRRLNAQTASLFYSVDRADLALYDCSALTSDAYIALANLCPSLKSLTLNLCGQLTADAVRHWGNRLQLRRLELFAPFLVKKDGWIDFFHATGVQLEGLLVTQSPRIDLETIEQLVQHCPNLTELRLSEIGQLDSTFVQPLCRLTQLRHLSLSAPGSSLTNEALTTLLQHVGKELSFLDLSDNAELDDDALPIIADNCPALRHLHLRNNVEFTDDGMAAFFDRLSKNEHPGLETIDLEKGHDLKNAALKALVSHSGDTIESLSLLGWREVDEEALGDLAQCPRLKELNLGWCRRVTDFTIKEVLDGCGEIQTIRVWGCNQLSDAVPRKRGVKIVGIETHSI